MPARVQPPFSAQTDRGLWDKSLRIFKCLCDNAPQSMRQLAQQTGGSKRSVPRLTQAMERRGGPPESWGWETAAGRWWCTRFVVATLSSFGLTRGVGVETSRACCARLRLATPGGGAPGA
jgi:hypothetical protein